jgi:hypothetical protein
VNGYKGTIKVGAIFLGHHHIFPDLSSRRDYPYPAAKPLIVLETLILCNFTKSTEQTMDGSRSVEKPTDKDETTSWKISRLTSDCPFAATASVASGQKSNPAAVCSCGDVTHRCGSSYSSTAQYSTAQH